MVLTTPLTCPPETIPSCSLLSHALRTGALDEFDCGRGERGGPEQPTPQPASVAAGNVCENETQLEGEDNGQSSAGPGKKGTGKFNPLGKRPKRQKPPTLPPPAINDLDDVSQEELEASAKELTALMQNMMKGSRPACLSLPSCMPWSTVCSTAREAPSNYSMRMR